MKWLLMILLLIVGCTSVETDDSDVCTFESCAPTSIVSLEDGDEITITAEKVMKTINGKTFEMYSYNGMIPGVALKAPQGSTVTVHFENMIDHNTTIHWHGLRHDIKNDGVPGISQDPVVPNGTHTYMVEFKDSGVFWYHPHIREDMQQDLGLYGNVLVVPEENYYNDVSYEELFVLDDILIKDDSIVSYGDKHGDHSLMGRYGNIMLVNGDTVYEREVSRGDVVRFYITNVANARPYNLSFGGAHMKLIGSDLSAYEKESFVDSIVIAPAERYIVEVQFLEGIYLIEHTTPFNRYTLGAITVNDDVSDPIEFEALREYEHVTNDIDSYREYFDKDVDYTIDLSIDMAEMGHGMMHNAPCHYMQQGWMGDCTLDGIEWEDTMPMMNARLTSEDITWILRNRETKSENMDMNLTAEVGDVVKIRLFNDPTSEHPMQHPIHLHGQRFLVLATDGVSHDNLAWKDTVLVPVGSTIDILVDVTNPGEWMMHCHIAEHLEAGMMTTLSVE